MITEIVIGVVSSLIATIGVIATSVGQIDKSPLITQDDRREIE